MTTVRAAAIPNPSSGCTGVEAKITISRSGTTFSPATVTVDAGQPVCWTWSGTEHTVKGDDGSFTSGPPTASGTFQRTFNAPGTYGYHCQVHGTPTSGMRGTVVVRGNSGAREPAPWRSCPTATRRMKESAP